MLTNLAGNIKEMRSYEEGWQSEKKGHCIQLTSFVLVELVSLTEITFKLRDSEMKLAMNWYLSWIMREIKMRTVGSLRV